MLPHALPDTAVRKTSVVLTLRNTSFATVSVLLLAILGDGHSIVNCYRPLKTWLVTACLLALTFHLVFSFGRHCEGCREWWFVLPRTSYGSLSFRITWALLLPAVWLWTVVGVFWLRDTMTETPDCFTAAGSITPVRVAALQLVFGTGAAFYSVLVANVWSAEGHMTANAAAISSVEDADLIDRWGRMEVSATPELTGGLTPGELASLPRFRFLAGQRTVDGEHTGGKDSSCAICLSPLVTGDEARSLPGCRHTFHRPCADLWLLRSQRCPLCNADVRARALTDLTDAMPKMGMTIHPQLCRYDCGYRDMCA